MSPMLAIGLPGGTEMVIIGILALLIFGRRLPDVARSMGKSIVEFKKGLRDVKDQIDGSTNSNNKMLPRNDSARNDPADPQTSEPGQQASNTSQNAPE